MGKATELKTTTKLVKEILESYPLARNSDDYLYVMVCRFINGNGINLSFKDVMLNRSKFNYPAFESVRRTRQKVQADHPELCGTSTVEGQRRLNEEVFKEYAKANI